MLELVVGCLTRRGKFALNPEDFKIPEQNGMCGLFALWPNIFMSNMNLIEYRFEAKYFRCVFNTGFDV